MAEYEVPRDHVGVHEKRLAADEVDVVRFERSLSEVEILTDGSANIYVTVGGGADPTVGGGDCWRVPPYAGSIIVQARHVGVRTVVKLISAGTPTYSVSRT